MISSASELDKLCKDELLRLARHTLESYLSTGRMPEYRANLPGLMSRAAAFVTLRREDDLRGCIGHLAPDRPLFETVQRCAVSAALEDLRFASVTYEELADLTIEISVLSPFTRVRDPREVEVGKHGLIITFAGKRGLLLPQVASENGWDRIDFLEQTCRKANLPPGTWRGTGAVLETFTAEVFSENARSAGAG